MITFENEFNSDIEVNPQKALMPTLIDEYEKVFMRTLITSFGLDLFIKDQHGGDVDTINNVENGVEFKNEMYKNQHKVAMSSYSQKEPYLHGKGVKPSDSADSEIKNLYEGQVRYNEIRKEYVTEARKGKLIDPYTGKKVDGLNTKNYDNEHIVSAHEINSSKARILSGIATEDLANTKENLVLVDSQVNRSKGARSIPEYLDYIHSTDKNTQLNKDRTMRDNLLKKKAAGELSENQEKTLTELNKKIEKFENLDEKKMKELDKKQRENISNAYNKGYYSFNSNSFSSIDEFKKSCLQFKNSQFFKDTQNAVYTRGLQMAVRQALGFALSEIYFEVRVEFKNQDNSNSFDLKDFFKKIIEGIKRGFSKVIKDYKQLLSSFANGALAGALSAISTTLINIFTTTLKNTGRIIRQSWASIVEALKVLFFNPDNLRLGDRIKAVLKIIATGATVVFGYYLNSILENSGIGAIPLVGSILSEVISGLVTGIISCTLLYFIDHNQSFNKIFELLNGPSIEESKEFYQEQAQKFEEYACKLEKIDVNKFKKEVDFYREVSSNLSGIKDSAKFNEYLKKLLEEMNSKLPWIGDFDEFMSNKNNRLTFE